MLLEDNSSYQSEACHRNLIQCLTETTAGCFLRCGVARSARPRETVAARHDRGSRPVSRVLSRAIIPLGPASPRASSGLPGSAGETPLRPVAGALLPYLALLQVGFAVPSSVATDAVRSYRTVSPLPARAREHGLGRFAFCCTFRELALPRRYLAPRPPEPGLSSIPAQRSW